MVCVIFDYDFKCGEEEKFREVIWFLWESRSVISRDDGGKVLLSLLWWQELLVV